MPIWYPDRDHIEIVESQLAAKYFGSTEGSPPNLFGLLKGDEGLAALESALGIIRQPYYRYVHHKAGALLRSLIKNHAFVDGNKRIAVITTVDFLLMNDHVLFAGDDELVEVALAIARSEPDTPWQDVAKWIAGHCVCFGGSSSRAMQRFKEHPREVRQRVARMRAAIRDVKESG